MSKYEEAIQYENTYHLERPDSGWIVIDNSFDYSLSSYSCVYKKDSVWHMGTGKTVLAHENSLLKIRFQDVQPDEAYITILYWKFKEN